MDEGLGIFWRWPKKGKVEGERKWELRELRRDEDGMESFGWKKWVGQVEQGRNVVFCCETKKRVKREGLRDITQP